MKIFKLGGIKETILFIIYFFKRFTLLSPSLKNDTWNLFTNLLICFSVCSRRASLVIKKVNRERLGCVDQMDR